MGNVYVASVNLSILFHFYKHHKDQLTLLRCWMIADCLDINAKGWVDIQTLITYARVSKKYIRKISKHNDSLFRSITADRAYLKSHRKILRNHKLYKYIKIRNEKINKKFFEQLKTKKRFEGYICKCYMERDLRKTKPKNYTQGRISYEMLAKEFNISRRTAISNLKKSTAKHYPNIRLFKNIRFKNKNEFGSWLINNIDNKINDHRIKENLFAYRMALDEKGYYLTRVLPNIYKFTGCKKSCA